MNQTDVTTILAKCSAYDNRKPAQATVAAWMDALDDMPLADALQFVTDHYRVSRDWIMPADLNREWQQLRAARQRAISEADRPVAPGDLSPEQFLTFRRALTRAVSEGVPVGGLATVAYAAIGREPEPKQITQTHHIDYTQIGHTA